MKRYFVSYEYKTDDGHGFGCTNVILKGVFTFNDIIGIKKVIEDKLKSIPETNYHNIHAVVLNWRKYDFSLSLWIKDIFNKIRGIK
jgi:hypothetical protein